MLRAHCYTPGAGWSEVVNLATISDLIATDGRLLWAQAHVEDLTPEQIETIAQEFGLHPLAVEDAINARQRPKLEGYENHLFSVMHQLDEIDDQLEASQIACFVGRSWVLTIHAGAQRMIDETTRRLRETEKEEGQGPSFIMHALLDAIVDDYEVIAARMEDRIEELEDVALRERRRPLQNELYSLKQQLARLRRYTLPGERVLAEVVAPGRFGMITSRTAEHFRDVHDHTLRIIDQIRNIDELVNAVIDLQRADQANALNEVTKRLTGWAAIIAVPTFIASVYGMNFELVPASGRRFGFWFALSLMASSGLGLYAFFRRRGWI